MCIDTQMSYTMFFMCINKLMELACYFCKQKQNILDKNHLGMVFSQEVSEMVKIYTNMENVLPQTILECK